MQTKCRSPGSVARELPPLPTLPILPALPLRHLVERKGPQGSGALNRPKTLGNASCCPSLHVQDPSISPTILETFSTSQTTHQFTIPLPYLFTNNLSLEGLYTYLPNTAKMGRKFFVGGNFKMYVYALFQVTPSTLTFPLPLGGLAC